MKNFLRLFSLVTLAFTCKISLSQGFNFNISLQGGGNCGYTVTGTYSAMNDSSIFGTFTAFGDPATGIYSANIGIVVNSVFVNVCATPIDPNCGVEACSSSVLTMNTGAVPNINIVFGSFSDADNDGFTAENGDCNDNDSSVNPYAPEICGDSLDNNCNGLVDDGNCNGSLVLNGQVINANASVEVFIMWSDSISGTSGMDSVMTATDGSFSYSMPGGIPMYYLYVQSCIYNCMNEYTCSYAYMAPNQPLTLVLNYCEIPTDSDNDGFLSDVDCDDFNATINPGADEICGDFVDNNCDGSFDENCGTSCSPNIVLVNDSMYPGIPSYTIYILNMEPTGVAPFTYLWNLGDGSVSNEPYPTNTYASTGSFIICLTVTSADGCSSEACITVSVDSMGYVSGGGFPMSPVFLNVIPSLDALLVPENMSSDMTTKVFPNPASSEISVSWNRNISTHFIEVIDLNGKSVLRQNVLTTQNNVTLSVDHLPAGLYHVALCNNDGWITSSRLMIGR
jgi:hypothetical protein